MAKNESSHARSVRRRDERKRRRQFQTSVVVVGVVGIVGLLIWAIQPRLTLPDSIESPSDADGLSWGPDNAEVIIEEFGDFQ